MTDQVDEGGRDTETVVKELGAQNTTATPSTASGLAALGSPTGKNIAEDNDSNTGIEPDALQPGQGPVGDQQKAAFFTRTGSIPGNSVPSPSGPVPASTIADEATRNAAVEAARAGARSTHEGTRNSRFRVSDDAARSMNPAALRAVAHDRGYEGVDGGRNSVLRKFLAEQAKDDSLEDPPEGHGLARRGFAVAPVPVAGAAAGNPLATPSRPGGLQDTAGNPVPAAPVVPPTAPKP